jgi:hypothetical protein
MKIDTAALLFTALLVLAGCTTMKVTSESDSGYDFSRINTYQWIDGPADILDDADTYINEDIQEAINTELTNRSMRQVMTAADADVQVAYYVKLKEETEYTTPAKQGEREFSGGFVYSRESSSWSYEEREPDINVYVVEVGSLTVLVYDAASGERIWRGTLKTRIDRAQPQEEQQNRIRKAVQKLMARLPVPSK